ADGRDGIIASLDHARDVRADFDDLAEILVADDQVRVPGGWLAIFARVDLLVGAVDADPQDLYEDAPAIGDVRNAWDRDILQMERVGPSGIDGDCFHRGLLMR